jgi:hypothetical protein
VSSLETVSVMISELATTQFSLIVLESTGAVCADESMCKHPKENIYIYLERER